jgi:hypothetical protein
MDPLTLIVTPHLEVDLTAQPWLASARRQAYPYYPVVLGGPGGNDWKHLENRHIKVQVVAEGSIVASDLPHFFKMPAPGVDATPPPARYEIRLVPQSEPIPVSRRRRH